MFAMHTKALLHHRKIISIEDIEATVSSECQAPGNLMELGVRRSYPASFSIFWHVSGMFRQTQWWELEMTWHNCGEPSHLSYQIRSTSCLFTCKNLGTWLREVRHKSICWQLTAGWLYERPECLDYVHHQAWVWDAEDLRNLHEFAEFVESTNYDELHKTN